MIDVKNILIIMLVFFIILVLCIGMTAAIFEVKNAETKARYIEEKTESINEMKELYKKLYEELKEKYRPKLTPTEKDYDNYL